MRLKELTLRSFRGFNEEETFDLDADVILIYGSNGTGKTSLFDAIRWLLYGDIPRLHGKDFKRDFNQFKNVHSENTPLISLQIVDDKRGLIEIRREGINSSYSEPSIIIGNEIIEGEDAQEKISEFIPDFVFDSAVYLGQHNVAKFIMDIPRGRYDTLSNILGFQKMRDFYETLKIQKKEILDKKIESLASIKKTLEDQIIGVQKHLAGEVEELYSRLIKEKMDLEDLERISGDDKAYLIETISIVGDQPKRKTIPIEELSSTLKELEESASILESALVDYHKDLKKMDSLIDELDRFKIGNKKRNDLIKEIEEKAQVYEENNKKINRIKAKINKLNTNLKKLEDEIKDQAGEKKGEVNFLSLAFDRIMTNKCPVCNQRIDPEETKELLKGKLRNMDEHYAKLFENLKSSQEQISSEIQLLKAEKERLSKLLEELNAEIKDRGREIQIEKERLDNFSDRFETIIKKSIRDLESDQIEQALITKSAQIKSTIESKESLKPLLETHIAKIEYAKKKIDFIREKKTLPSVTNEITRLNTEIERLESLSAKIDEVERKSREMELETTKRTIQNMQPQLTENYSRLNPHPLFNSLKFDFNLLPRLGGEIYFKSNYKETEVNVKTIFSEAQANSVALCIFLTFSLLKKDESLNSILLDDPIQNMDDLNVLGFIDLLKAHREEKQTILATHDRDFFEVLSEKLIPTKAGQRQIRYILKNYDELGPEVVKEIKEFEPQLIEKSLEETVMAAVL